MRGTAQLTDVWREAPGGGLEYAYSKRSGDSRKSEYIVHAY